MNFATAYERINDLVVINHKQAEQNDYHQFVCLSEGNGRKLRELRKLRFEIDATQSGKQCLGQI